MWYSYLLFKATSNPNLRFEEAAFLLTHSYIGSKVHAQPSFWLDQVGVLVVWDWEQNNCLSPKYFYFSALVRIDFAKRIINQGYLMARFTKKKEKRKGM